MGKAEEGRSGRGDVCGDVRGGEGGGGGGGGDGGYVWGVEGKEEGGRGEGSEWCGTGWRAGGRGGRLTSLKIGDVAKAATWLIAECSPESSRYKNRCVLGMLSTYKLIV